MIICVGASIFVHLSLSLHFVSISRLSLSFSLSFSLSLSLTFRSLSSFILLSLFVSFPLMPSQHLHCSLVTWQLRHRSWAAGSDHQNVSWHSCAQRPLACKADSSNLKEVEVKGQDIGGRGGREGGREDKGAVSHPVRVMCWDHMLTVLAACLSKQHEF